MENRSHALAAGLFVVVLGVALAAISVWFGKGDDLKLAPFLIMTTADVSGLKSEAPVRYRGVDVGRVQSIRLKPEGRGLIEIRIGLEPATPVTAATYAQLGYLGVTGITFISLQDKSTGGELVTTSADKPAVISMKPSLMDSGENLLGSVGELVERASTLLNEENRGRAAKLLANAEQATGRLSTLAERLEPTAKQLPALVTDARGALVAVRSAAARAEDLSGTVNALALKVETRLDMLNTMAASAEDVGAAARTIQDETVPRLNALADGLTRQSRSMERVIHTFSEQPQSLVFGNAPPRAGPGEPGYQGSTK